MEIVIRKDIGKYMEELRSWLETQREIPLEDMDGFFASRVKIYDEHMSLWKEAYRILPDYLPEKVDTILDLGIGTGLELEAIYRKFPSVSVTGIDLSRAMLDELERKYPDRKFTAVCGDYFEENFGPDYDAVVSVESLHHFSPIEKGKLYRKIYHSLKRGGTFLLCDYIACCEEEEALLAKECMRKKKAQGISDGELVHFDTPLTLARELSLLRAAGFVSAEAVNSIEGATIIVSVK